MPGVVVPPGGGMEPKRPRAPSPLAMAASPPPSPPPSSLEPAAPLAFTGSNEQDVALAKSFWNSVTLQPPLESCLAPRRVSRGSSIPSGASSRKGSTSTAAEEEAEECNGNEWKEKFLEKAKRREEIMSLLKKQREERISKESLSRQQKPKLKEKQKEQENAEKKKSIRDSDLEDEESVKALP